MWLVTVIRLLLAVLSLRGMCWAYVAFIILGLLYFPLKVGFRFDPHPCELIFGSRLAIHRAEGAGCTDLFLKFRNHPQITQLPPGQRWRREISD